MDEALLWEIRAFVYRHFANTTQPPSVEETASHFALTHDEIGAYYVDKWGSQEVLASPIDKGFNRLAWLLPYGIGATGVLTIAGLALKWSRRAAPMPSPAAATAGANQALEQRLDDELRDLD